jgi:hypothetical protein
MKTTFAPGIVTRWGDTIYPTGDEWLLFFALKGCKWAVEALEEREKKIKVEQQRWEDDELTGFY